MNSIITIGRQYGSGGHEIGQKLAEKFNVRYFDKELLKRAAKDSGMCPEIFENHDERPTSSFLYNLVMDTYSFGLNNSNYFDMPISHKVFLAQFEAIKNIANEGSCVIVGRCADYALSEYNNCLNIFIYADLSKRIERVSRINGVSADDAKDLIIKKDKQRANYYNYYSTKKWGHADTYDLCVDSSVLGTEGTVELISQFVNDFEKAKNL